MYPEDEQAKRPDRALDLLDHQLERFDKALAALNERVMAVTNQYATMTEAASEPRPEPATALRGRIERLSDLLGRLEQITSEIDL